MNSDRFDSIVRDVLLERAPAETPPELRARVAAVPGEVRQPRWASRLLAVAGGVAAVAVVGATLAIVASLHAITVGPGGAGPSAAGAPGPLAHFEGDGFGFDYPASWRVILEYRGASATLVSVGTAGTSVACVRPTPGHAGSTALECAGMNDWTVPADGVVVLYRAQGSPGFPAVIAGLGPSPMPGATRVSVAGRLADRLETTTSLVWRFDGQGTSAIEARFGIAAAPTARAQIEALVGSWHWGGALPASPSSPGPTFGQAAPGGSAPPIDAGPWAGLSLRALDQAPTYPATLASWDGGYLALHDGTSDFGAWISRDGRSWTALARGTFGQASIGFAAGAGGRVFAVTQTFDGTEQAWVSTDGMHWSATPGGCPPTRTSGEEQLAGTAVGLIAVTGDPQYQLAFTADGASWTTVALPGAGLDSVQAVAAIGDTFVAVGSLGTNSLTSHSTPAAWWSTDGVHWSVARVAAHPGDGLYRVAAGGPGLVAVSLTPGGTPGKASFWTSPDGRTWSLSDADPLGTWTPAVGGPGVEGSANGVFTGDGTRILGYGTRDLSKGLEYWSSADGTNWNRLALSGGPAGGADGQPFLLRDGVLFVGPNGTWFGQAVR